MATLRVRKDSNYSCINNQPLRDVTLSWAARGLLAYLLSMPDNWQVNTDQLIEQSPAGRDHVLSLLRELEAIGYFVRRRKKNPEGKWEWERTIHETPQKTNEQPQAVFPPMEKPVIKEVLTNQVLNPTKTPLPPQPEPSIPYQSDEFKSALAAFEQHRKEIRHPFTPLAREALYKKLRRFGERMAIEQIYESIENGWQGVFEPKSNGFMSQAEMNRGGRGKLVI